MTAGDTRRRVILAGHLGDSATALAHLSHSDADVRAASLGALERAGELTPDQLVHAFADASPIVRRRAAEAAGHRPEVSLAVLLGDPDATVVEVAAFACGEQESVADDVLDRLITLATKHAEPLVRESAAAALGAIGDVRGLPAILHATEDKPAIRRRAVLALAPFEGPEVDAAIERALTDRDWQVRQAAEDLQRASGEY